MTARVWHKGRAGQPVTLCGEPIAADWATLLCAAPIPASTVTTRCETCAILANALQ